MYDDLCCPRCQLKDDFIPGGKRVNEVISIRELLPIEFFQCCVATGDDIQSSPIYCGRRASFEGKTSDGKVTHTCKSHEGGLKRLLKKQPELDFQI